MLGVPDGGEVGEAVDPVTVGVAGPGDQEEPGLLAGGAGVGSLLARPGQVPTLLSLLQVCGGTLSGL